MKASAILVRRGSPDLAETDDRRSPTWNRLLAIALYLLFPNTVLADDRPTVLTVVGAAGLPEYGGPFRDWANRWQAAARKASVESIQIGLDDNTGKPTTDRELLRSTLAAHASVSASHEPLWIVLIGHGTFDGKEAKFNLRGPDVSDVELAQWLAAIKRPLVFINCASASGPFLSRLSGPGRVIVTATRSGDEQNFAHFGGYLAESIADDRADLDKDGQVSLLEAFLSASGRTAEWYRSKSQLATEHALIDDNGDHLGTPADWFRGVRAVRRAKDGASADGLRGHQIHLIPGAGERALSPEVRAKRDALERSVASLRDQKSKLAEDDYYARLEALMTDLARLYNGQVSPSRPATR
jgi:hypothetical protein